MSRRSTIFIFVLAACGRSGGGIGASGGGGGDPSAWLAPCDAAIAQAAHEPAWQRARTIADGCRVCGVPWDDVLAEKLPAPSRVIAVIDACKLDCSTQARAAFYAAVSALEEGQPPRDAWLAFDKACPAVLGPIASLGPDPRYASSAWFVLEQVARARAAAHRAPPDYDLALPLWSQLGGGFVLPHADGAAIADVPDGPLVTLTNGARFAVDAPPRLRFTDGGLAIAHVAWPGTPAAAGGAPPAHYTLVAPVALDVAKLRAAIDELGPPDAIVVATPAAHTLFGGEAGVLALPHPLPAGWPPAAGKIDAAVRALEAASPHAAP